MKKIHIGLDIGIASVGWAVLDDDLKIIKHGVRMFDHLEHGTSNELLSAARRAARAQRRQVTRRKTLKRDFIKWALNEKMITLDYPEKVDAGIDKSKPITEYKELVIKEFTEKYIKTNYSEKVDGLPSILGLRKRALSSKLSLEDLVRVLYWYLANRGYKYEDNDKSTKGDEEKFKELVNKTGELPVDVQINFFNEAGYYRGALNRYFSNKKYQLELEIILKNQELTNDQIEYYLGLYTRQKSFEIGPGNEKTPSKYGVYTLENGKVIRKYENVWEKTIGKCSIFSNEFRAPKNSTSAQVFNLLNDLNNITINGNTKLTTEDKISIINNIAIKASTDTTCAKNTIKYICDKYELDIKEAMEEGNKIVAGFRINKKNQPIMSLVTIPNKLNVGSIVNPDCTFDFAEFDDVALLFNKTTVKEIREEKLNKKYSEYFEKLSAVPGWSGTHAYSLKALKLLIEKMLVSNQNSMQIVYSECLVNDVKNNIITEGGYIKTNWIFDLIASPTIKRSINQSVGVLNALIKKYKKEYTVGSITIEMARETNNKKAKLQEKERQAYLEKRNKENAKYIEEVERLSGRKCSSKALFKLMLFDEQCGKDAYTGEELNKFDLIIHPGYADIDHIIPYSKSFDNSMANKVLTKHVNNSAKGNRTPFMWMNNSDFDRMSKIWNSWYAKAGNRKVAAKKLENLLDRTNYNIDGANIDFIGRNLADTRYITREVLAAVKKLAEHKNYPDLKVSVINGRVTSYIKGSMDSRSAPLLIPEEFGTPFVYDEKLGREVKNRSWNGHHAQDAAIVAFVSNAGYVNAKTIEKIISDPLYINGKKKEYIDAQINSSNKLSDLIAKADMFKLELNKNISEVRFSYKKEFKTNTRLFNETVYGSKIVGEKLITVESKKLVDLDYKKAYDVLNSEKLLMAQDRGGQKVFAELKKILELYSNEKLPFRAYVDKNSKIVGDDLVRFTLKTDLGNDINYAVKVVKSLSSDVDVDSVIFKKDGSGFNKSMEWVKGRVYTDAKGKAKLIAINATNTKFVNGQVITDEDKIMRIMKAQGVSNFDSYLELDKNEIVRFYCTKANRVRTFRVVGLIPQAHKIEVKAIDSLPIPGKRDQRALNSLMDNGLKIVKMSKV